jgi:hypothetical protein
MRRIFTCAAIIIATFSISQSRAQCLTSAGVCSDIIDNFASDPIPKNFNLMGFVWTGFDVSGQHLRVPSAAPSSDYHITTPAYYMTSGGVVNVGFNISTWTGSNNFFTVGSLNLAIDVINASTNAVVASCMGNVISSAGKYCFQISSANITAGMMVKYRFMFETSAGVTGTRVINFDDLAVSALQQAVLPVTFMSISGTKITTGNKIAWTVGTETNVKQYEIEKSGNGKTFSLIGTVTATGTSAYSFVDVNPGTATAYYRIKSKDIDGTTKISPVVAIKATTTKGGKGKIALGAYPTPTSDELFVSHDEADMSCALTIVSVDGRMVKSFVPQKGSIQTTLNMSALQPGMYFVRYQAADGEVETIKVVKK